LAVSAQAHRSFGLKWNWEKHEQMKNIF